MPERLQAILARCEIRVGLEKTDVTLACKRVAVALPYVYALKRLCQHTKDLTQEEFKRAVTSAVT